MAVALLERHLTRAGVAATVTSAGLVSDGVPASAHAVDEMARRGIDIRHHRSRRLTVDAVERADLVIGMARMHAREAVLLDRSALPRTFTLRDLVRRADALDGSHPDGFPGWLAHVGGVRTTADLVGERAADDVVDPIGMPADAYIKCASELDDLLGRLASHLARLRVDSPQSS
jgi:protein-tyrosine phosphatase